MPGRFGLAKEEGGLNYMWPLILRTLGRAGAIGRACRVVATEKCIRKAVTMGLRKSAGEFA